MRGALIAVGALVVALVLYETWPDDARPDADGMDVTELLGAADTTGFERASGERTFRFPDDHGPHPGYRTEWWYFTGNLSTDAGRDFGYQLTFFRSALTPEEADAGPSADGGATSAWATRQIYMAHFALTDIGDRRFFANERFSRAALELAGAQSAPFRVWLEDWNAESTDAGFLPLRLQASGDGVALSLNLVDGKPLVLQGDGGLSPKGAEPGNASWYYSFTRLLTEGEVRVGDAGFAVRGTSWMDREWSTSALAPHLAGWDWFALQLSDGHDLMVYQLRTKAGGVDPFSAATLVDEQGHATHLDSTAFELEPLSFWSSPGGTRYPIRWRVRIPDVRIDLTVEAAMPDQELDVSVRYWEGSVRVSGEHEGRPVTGRGYLEMTGYATTANTRRGRAPVQER